MVENCTIITYRLFFHRQTSKSFVQLCQRTGFKMYIIFWFLTVKIHEKGSIVNMLRRSLSGAWLALRCGCIAHCTFQFIGDFVVVIHNRYYLSNNEHFAVVKIPKDTIYYLLYVIKIDFFCSALALRWNRPYNRIMSYWRNTSHPGWTKYRGAT